MEHNPTHPQPAAGTSFVFTFPFWIFVEVEGGPTVHRIEMGGCKFCVYAPFRSAPANFINMPYVDLQAIPFHEGTRPEIGPEYDPPRLAAVPRIRRADGDVAVTLAWGRQFEELRCPPKTGPVNMSLLENDEEVIRCDGAGSRKRRLSGS